MKNVCLLVLIVLVTNFFLLYGDFNRPILAQAETFGTIIPFAQQDGTYLFFDQKDGKIYHYNGDFKICFGIYQIQKLGQPLQQIQ